MKARKKKRKSDLALQVELATGQLINEYLGDKASLKWSWDMILDDVNSRIMKLSRAKIIEKKLFMVKKTNLNRWYRMYGIKSKVKKGRTKIVSRETICPKRRVLNVS